MENRIIGREKKSIFGSGLQIDRQKCKPGTKIGVECNSFPSMLVANTVTAILDEELQCVDGTFKLCPHLLFIQSEANEMG